MWVHSAHLCHRAIEFNRGDVGASSVRHARRVRQPRANIEQSRILAYGRDRSQLFLRVFLRIDADAEPMHAKPRDQRRGPRALAARHQRNRSFGVVAKRHHLARPTSEPIVLIGRLVHPSLIARDRFDRIPSHEHLAVAVQRRPRAERVHARVVRRRKVKIPADFARRLAVRARVEQPPRFVVRDQRRSRIERRKRRGVPTPRRVVVVARGARGGARGRLAAARTRARRARAGGVGRRARVERGAHVYARASDRGARESDV